MARLSVVIPTLNEEAYLGQLLESIDRQTFQDFEVIVSDSGSDDDTVRIAEEYGAEVVSGPRNGPGYARNIGVERADGDILLFLDADIVVPEGMFSRIMQTVEQDDVVAGSAVLKAHDVTGKDKFLFDLGSKMLEWVHRANVFPAAPSPFIFLERDVFEAIDGFDEELPYCEDHHLLASAGNHGDVAIVGSVYGSARRMDQKGVFRTVAEYWPPTFLYLTKRYDRLKERHEFGTVS